jgi:hypothetical protein
VKLRPVNFSHKKDTTGMFQYGMVAEEVERVYPELVIRRSDGKVESVRKSNPTNYKSRIGKRENWQSGWRRRTSSR